MLNLRFHSSALKELQALPPKHYKQVVGKVLSLIENPLPNDTRLMKGVDGSLYRVSSGEYRIVYRFSEVDLFIEAIGARNDDAVYKSLLRREK